MEQFLSAAGEVVEEVCMSTVGELAVEGSMLAAGDVGRDPC